MAKKDEEYLPSEGEGSQFVSVMFARNGEDAERYRELLEDHGVPAIIGQEHAPQALDDSPPRPSMTRGVEVMVPEELLDEASEIIADREDLDEFTAIDDGMDDDEDEDELDFGEESAPGIHGAFDDDEDEEDDKDDFLEDADEAE